MIWDQIIVEVTKMWDFLNVVEDKRFLVRNALAKDETTNELMQKEDLHKEPKMFLIS